MKPIIIIADDLTGACDTGIKFHNAGLKTRVLTKPLPADAFSAPDIPVLSVNTDSRCMPPELAGETVRSLLTALRDKEDFYLYKKVDSVLRGNVMAEIDGVFEALEPDFVLITPAFPETGRRVRRGVLHIRGPQGQEDAVNALELLQNQTRRACALIDSTVVRQGAGAVAARARELNRTGATVLLADAWAQEDLDILAEAVMELGEGCIPAGSAGLAQSIAAGLSVRASQPQPREPASPGSTLVVVGTRHPATLHQLQKLKESADLKTYLIPAKGITQEDLAGELQRALERPLNPEGRDGLLLTTDRIYQGNGSHCVPLLHNEHNHLIREALGMGVKELVGAWNISGIIATGGDVAVEVLNRLELQWIDLMTEPIPGIVAGTAGGGPGKQFLITTKSGGFGGEDALVKMLQYISSENKGGESLCSTPAGS